MFLREFADSSVNFLLLFWINDVIDGRYGRKAMYYSQFGKSLKKIILKSLSSKRYSYQREFD